MESTHTFAMITESMGEVGVAEPVDAAAEDPQIWSPTLNSPR